MRPGERPDVWSVVPGRRYVRNLYADGDPLTDGDADSHLHAHADQHANRDADFDRNTESSADSNADTWCQ